MQFQTALNICIIKNVTRLNTRGKHVIYNFYHFKSLLPRVFFFRSSFTEMFSFQFHRNYDTEDFFSQINV